MPTRPYPISRRTATWLIVPFLACATTQEDHVSTRRADPAGLERPIPRPDPRRPGDRPKLDALDALAARVSAPRAPVENPCRGDGCQTRALTGFYRKLDALARDGKPRVRILQLGDSHIAADYITKTARSELQRRFGSSGRGFVHADQLNKYGGRRLRKYGDWVRRRIVDRGQSGERFGFSGLVLESNGRSASIDYRLRSEEIVKLHYLTHPKGARISVYADAVRIGRIRTRSKKPGLRSKVMRIPRQSRNGGRLKVRAHGKGAQILGLSFEKKRSGVLYDSVGPVGADARVYRQLDKSSMQSHLRALNPDLVILMVGGNDALRLKQGRTTAGEIHQDMERVVARLQIALPNADCMLWSPMDAAIRRNGRLESRPYHDTVRDIQKRVAQDNGCAFWDLFEAMGAEGSFGRWHGAGIMNDDLIHPRSKAGQLIGYLFSEALMEDYDLGL